MWDFLTPRYPGLRFCFPRDMEACILDVQVNVGIQFPLCEDLEELCRYYDIAPTQLVSHAFQMCAWYCLMCTRHSWTYPPFVVFTDWLGHQPLLLFQHRLPKFIEWCSEGWNLATYFQIDNEFRSSSSNYKKLYLFYQCGIFWLLQPFKDTSRSFDKLSRSDRNVIDNLFCRHRRPNFHLIYSTEETSEANLCLSAIPFSLLCLLTW